MLSKKAHILVTRRCKHALLNQCQLAYFCQGNKWKFNPTLLMIDNNFKVNMIKQQHIETKDCCVSDTSVIVL